MIPRVLAARSSRCFREPVGRMARRLHGTKPDLSVGSSPDTDLTRLGQHIRDIIVATGPISVSKYMQLALTSPIGGYYTRGQVFGSSGDFITSPEISQMYGELLAIWFVLHWEQTGRPSRTSFVELGPGRGTLMSDMLRASRKFPEFFATIQTVHMVERSPELRKVQHDVLGCEWEKTERMEDAPVDTPKRSVGRGLRVEWHDSVEQVQMDSAPFVVAHEFFDALPVHKFERGAKDAWHEILIDVAEPKAPTVLTPKYMGSLQPAPTTAQFKYVRTRSNSASAAMLMRDPRVVAQFEQGDKVEVAPEGARIMAWLAELISEHGGLGLVIDYGQDWTQGDTFRGIRKHKFADPLSCPGSMDLTADVDFSYLRFVARDLAQCHGPIEQGTFLHALGIQARLQQLLNSTKDRKVQQDLVDCYKRLTDPQSMGRVYKVMAVLPKSSTCMPVPFAPPTKDELNKIKVEKIVK
ncbi:hypothetical protein LPJ77_003962 [Coemansia sp. RSA 2523]|nr:hypothetical protein LPJ77_003962 [Coemansia sp. RSA 2523]KAJ2426297.1 hypothetical protein GGF47_002214 [Coemansia sp. RSA 2524]